VATRDTILSLQRLMSGASSSFRLHRGFAIMRSSGDDGAELFDQALGCDKVMSCWQEWRTKGDYRRGFRWIATGETES